MRKQTTGMVSFDEVLEGGFPCERVSIVRGGHGAGKTVVALNFLYQNALAGRPGVFVSFEEDAESIRLNARSMGWDLERLEAEKQLAIIALDVSPLLITSGDFDIGGSIAIIEHTAKSIGAELLVVDAIDWLLSLFEQQKDRRRHLQVFHRAMRDAKFTTVLTVKDSIDEADLLDYVADCVVRLDLRVERQIAVRRLRVTKYRGSGFLSHEHPFIITNQGPKMLPVSGVSLTYDGLKKRVSTGNKVLDAHLGGGYFKGSCVILAGGSGTGKTTLMATFAAAAGTAGDRVLYFSFEESENSLVCSMRSPGVDLETPVKSGHLELKSSLPEAKGVDLQLSEIVEAMDRFQPDHILIDAISSAERMGSQQAAFDFQIRLFYLCKDRGVTCLCGYQARELSVANEIGRMDLSSLAETVISLEQQFLESGFQRRLAIIKSRGTDHSDGLYPFQICSDGMEVNTESCAGHG